MSLTKVSYSMITGAPVNIMDFGVVGDGVADDTAAFNLARQAALGKQLNISGTPLISSLLSITQKECWIFEGANGNSNGNYPDSYLIKAATVAGDLVTIIAQGTTISGGGIVGQVGNTGNGYTIQSNSVTLNNPFVTLMGGDGIRVGKDTGVNSNSFRINTPVCSYNVGRGIYINDLTGALGNANAGMVFHPFCQSNGSHGIHINTGFYNTVVCPLLESNAGNGLNLDTYSLYNIIVGGDSEANFGGTTYLAYDIYLAYPNNNTIINLASNGQTYTSPVTTVNSIQGITNQASTWLKNIGFTDTFKLLPSEGWVNGGGSPTIGGGTINLPPTPSFVGQTIQTQIGSSYTLRINITGGSSRSVVRVGSTTNIYGSYGFDIVNSGYLSDGVYSVTFTATKQYTSITLLNDLGGGATSVFSNMSLTTNIASAGDIAVTVLGAGVCIKEGTNSKQGVVALVAGSAVVSNITITPNSRIFITSNTDGGTPGWVRVSNRTSGVSFTITSSSATDTSVIAYEIFEPA